MLTTLTLTNAIAQVAATGNAPATSGGQNTFVYVVAVVIVVAIVLAYFRAHMDVNADASAAKPTPAAAKVSAAPVAAASVEDPRLVAVIAAAAYVSLGQNVSIVSIQPVSAEWSTQGRRDIFLSHRIR